MPSQSPSIAKRLIAAALVAAVVGAPTVVQAQGEYDQLEATRREIDAIKSRLGPVKADAAVIRRQVQRLDNQIADLDYQITTGEHDISSLESEIRTHTAQIKELRTEYSQALKASAERARDLYKKGPIDTIGRLLDAGSVGDFVRRAMMWEVAAEVEGKVMIDSARLKGRLEDRNAKLAVIQADLDQQRRWLEERRALVADARSQRSSALGKLDAQIEHEESHIRGLEAAARRLEYIIAARLSRSSGTVSTSGFIWPLIGRITSPYGYRWGGFHTGIDIDGTYGQPVRASKAGYVMGIACGGGYGICSIIDHGGGVATLYAHLSGKAVGSGYVQQGQVVGWVGCTGYCTGDHLHFEVRVNGSPRNPMNFLP